MNFSLLLKELREAITFRSLGSWFQRLLPLYFTDLGRAGFTPSGAPVQKKCGGP